MADRRPPSVVRPSGSRDALRDPRPDAQGHVQRPSAPAAPARQRERAWEAPAWEKVATQADARSPISHRMTDRLAERRKRARRRAIVAAGRWAALAGVAAAAAWAVLASPVFALDTEGVEWVGLATEIDAAAAEGVVAAIEGDSLVTVDTGELEGALEQVAGVREAAVQRVWPSGLRVTLVARSPVAAVPDQAGFVLLDADAVAVGTVTAAPTDVPIVEVPVGDERILAAVLEVIKSLPAELLARVGTVSAATEDSIGFTLSDGPRVEWGSAEDSALKAQVLEAMIASGAANGVAVVDVSAPTLPITKASA